MNSRQIKCEACDGTGWVGDGNGHDCEQCDAEGSIIVAPISHIDEEAFERIYQTIINGGYVPLEVRGLQKRISELETDYKNLKNSIQSHFQTLIARNYNNIGKWSNEKQQYNFELIQEVEALLIKHNTRAALTPKTP